MRHNYLPRFGGVVLGLAGAIACSDPVAPAAPNDSRLVLTAATAPGDTLAQLGLDITAALRDSSLVRGLRVYIDSATSPAPYQDLSLPEYFPRPTSTTRIAVFVPTPGRHTITVVVLDSTGRPASASLTRTFAVPAADYAAVPLPGLGGDARAVYVHANGDAAGWVADPSGRKRPAIWHAGQLTVITVSDTTDVVATRVNSSGDVLLQGRSFRYPQDTVGLNYTAVRVRRADGAVADIGPYHIGPYDYFGRTCCVIAGDLDDNRIALASSDDVVSSEGYAFHRMAVRYDVRTGVPIDTLDAPYSRFAANGALAGTGYGYDYGMAGSRVLTRGFTLPSFPTGPQVGSICDAAVSGRWRVQFLVDLDDAGNTVVGRECTSYAYLSPAGSVWLDRYVGQTFGGAIHLSRQGGLVASLDSTGAVYVWNAATQRAARVRAALPTSAKLDGLGGVNAAGQIVVHGVDTATKKGGAFLLTPATAR